MINRIEHTNRIVTLLNQFPVVGIIGPRQVGKTTLARQVCDLIKQDILFFDLEDPDDLAQLEEPKLAFGKFEGLVVLDEIQMRPDLFPILRVLVDRPENQTMFLVLGSASPTLLKQSSDTLAGRIAYHKLGGFSLDEVGIQNAEKLWLRGGFPLSYLATDDTASLEWRLSFIDTFLNRDIPQLGFNIPGITLHRFWQMMAHYHGQLWNGSELGRAFGVAHTTVRNYLDILTDTFIIFQLQPWFENIKKRQVKSPKVYISDTGLLHAIMKIETMDDLKGHPKIGASWEGFVINETLRQLKCKPGEVYFWAIHASAELDLLIIKGEKRIGFEIKRTTSPRTSKSMHSSIKSLDLQQLYIVHAGEKSYPMKENIEAVAFSDLTRFFKTGLGIQKNKNKLDIQIISQ